MPTIHFDQDDISLFQTASHDRNPLHVSAQYARKSSFGNPVVFGVLGLLKAIGTLKPEQQQGLESVTVQFRNPMFQNADYSVESKVVKEGQIKLVVSDAGKSLLTGKLVLRGRPHSAVGQTDPKFSRTEAAVLKSHDLKEGLELEGDYAPEITSLRLLLEKCGLPEMGNAASPIATLLLSSFLVGMELPGEGALFSQIKVKFLAAAVEHNVPLHYQAKVVSFDDRFGLLETLVTITAGGVPFAEMELSAYLRPDPPTLNLEALAERLPASETLRGKTALVVGGSRGLGAAIVAALASQGCHVILNYLASKSDAEALLKSTPAGWGQISLEQGDATDPAWCQQINGRLAESGGLDFLVCNAVPSIPNLPFSPKTLARGQQFVDASIAMVASPLAAFLPSLNDRQGTAIVMSTIAVAEDYEDIPPDWYHYIMAKKAIEGLIRYLALGSGKNRFLVVRPPRLLTDQTNTIAGRSAGLPVESAATTIVRKLISLADAPRYTLLSEFECLPNDVN